MNNNENNENIKKKFLKNKKINRIIQIFDQFTDFGISKLLTKL